MPHNIMADSSLISASPFHAVSRVEVFIDPDPRAQQAYKIGSIKDGDSWIKTFALTKIGIGKLLNAAGVETIKIDSANPQERVWVAYYTGELTRPDGTKRSETKSKTIDLREGIGARWIKEKEKHFDKLLRDWGFRNGRKPKNKERFEDHAIRCKYELSQEDPNELKRLEFIAKEKANRWANQAAQFGSELAETGAVDRFARTIFNLGTYTAASLKEPFIVYRARFDHTSLQEHFGEDMADRLLLGQAASELGIDVKAIMSLPERIEEVEDAESFEIGPFDEDAELEQKEAIYKHFENSDADVGSNYLFGKPMDDLSVGEAELMLVYIRLSGSTTGSPDRKVLMEHAKQRIQLCVQERREWNPETDEQLELNIG